MATTTGLYVEYGSYKHREGELRLEIDKETLMTDARTPYAIRHTISLLDGLLLGDSVKDIDNQVKALDAAYATHNQTFKFKTSAMETALCIDPSDTLDGVRVIQPPSFDRMQRSAYGNHLFYSVVLEAVVVLGTRTTDILSYSETITKKGGGPRYGILTTRRGMPVFQKLSEHTPFLAEQRGQAVGLFARPRPARPLWPQWQLENVELTLQNATRSNTEYSISWAYSFASPVRLIGNPHRWGTF